MPLVLTTVQFAIALSGPVFTFSALSMATVSNEGEGCLLGCLPAA